MKFKQIFTFLICLVLVFSIKMPKVSASAYQYDWGLCWWLSNSSSGYTDSDGIWHSWYDANPAYPHSKYDHWSGTVNWDTWSNNGNAWLASNNIPSDWPSSNYKYYGVEYGNFYAYPGGPVNHYRREFLIYYKRSVPTASSITSSGNLKQTDGYYYVYANGVSDYTGISTVYFPTWTIANGQDELKWYQGTNLGNGTWRAVIPLSEHNNETGQYHTDVYATNGQGYQGYIGGTDVYVTASNPTGSISINGGAGYTNITNVTLNMSAAGNTTLNNSGFELYSSPGGGTNGSPADYWGKYQTGSITTSIDRNTTYKHSGSNSQAIYVTGTSANNQVAVVYQDNSATPGKAYTLNAYAGTNLTGFVQLEFWTAGRGTQLSTARTTFTSSNSDLNNIAQTVTATAPAGTAIVTATLGVMANTGQTGYVLYDDASLTEDPQMMVGNDSSFTGSHWETYTKAANGWSGLWWNRNSGNYTTIDENVPASENSVYNTIDFTNYNVQGQTNYMDSRFQGYITPAYSQAYTLYATSDDGVQVWFNGALVINSWVGQAPTTYTYTTPVLQAGKKYKIEITHFQGTGGERLLLEWSSPSQPRQIIPSSAVSTTPYSWTVPSGDGAKTVYVKFRDAFGHISSTYSDTITLDTTIPSVSSTSPVNGTTNVALTSPITVTFTQNILPSTNYSSITVKNSAGTVVSTNNSISGGVLTLTPTSNLAESTTYTVTIPASSVKNLAGTNLPSQYTFSFTTMAVPPTVSSTSPANGVGNVSISGNITVTFSENIASSANYSSITLKNSAGTIIAINKTISGAVLTLDPTANLPGRTTYTVTIPASSVKDLAGNNLVSQYTFSFTTQPIIPTLNTPTITNGSIWLGEDITVDATGTNISNTPSAPSYRIYYTTSALPPAIGTGTTPGSWWYDSGVSGTMNLTGNTDVSKIIAAANYTGVNWTYVTIKVWAASSTNDAAWKYSQAYALSNDGVSAINYVGHNQIISIPNSNVQGGIEYMTVSDPDTPVQQYGPYNSTRSMLEQRNIFIDGDYVQYRFEFDVLNPSIVQDMEIAFDFNYLNEEGIELTPQSMNLQKLQTNGSFATIKNLTFTKQSRNRYIVRLGNDNYGTPMIIANGQGRYAVQYTTLLSVKSGYASQTILMRNNAQMSIYSNGGSYPDVMEPERSGRIFDIDTKVWKELVQYR